MKKEYPQTVAVILSKIKSDHAARVISSLTGEALCSFLFIKITRIFKLGGNIL